MKSRINTLTDYRTVPLEKEVVIPSPQAHVQKEFRQLTRKYKYTVPVDTLQEGDVAFLKLTSDLPRYQKSMLPVTVGSGLFDRELETQLLGHKEGDCLKVSVQEQTVEVRILKASRTRYPEPTDEMAATYAAEHEAYAKAVTVEAYRQQVTEEYYRSRWEDIFGEAMQTLMDAVLTTSDWDFDDEEVQSLADRLFAENTASLEEEEGKKLTDMTAEELRRATGVDSVEEMKAFCKSNSEQWIATILWCAHENGRDAARLELNLDNPDIINYKFLEDYVHSTITIKEE